MAITSITVVQDNFIDSSPLLAVHNPLIFIAEADYTGATPPDELYVSESINSKVYSCIPYSDPQAGKRQFMFIADEILRGMMGEIDDVVQTDTSTIHQDQQLLVLLTFYDPSNPTTEVKLDVIAIHGTRQFGESPCLEAIYTNEDETILGVVGFPCYAYLFNNDIANVITVSET
jgi:hypothetical protein